MTINQNFDSGNIEIIDLQNPENIQLNIRRDRDSEFFQWFHFRLLGAKGQSCRMRLMNASEAAFPGGWENYHAVASYDRQEWFRVESHYDGKELVIEHQPEVDSIYYAYFAPYSWERHQDLVSWTQQSPLCQLHSLGRTLDGHDVDLLKISEEQGAEQSEKRKIWITARQHPGESMAEWFMEGVIGRLLDPADPVARLLLQNADFYLVPNMNPDGSIRGHLRTNAIGVNLNREWHAPSLERSPEVFCVMEKMIQTGVDLFLDVHGDEALPYNFVAGCEANPGYSQRISSLEEMFKSHYMLASPDFQVEQGYGKSKFGEETLTLACNQVGQRFDCLSFTIEMPFKDNADHPDPVQGWSPERSQKLGEAVLQPILAVIDQVR
ncbi:hypothetical protein BGP75_07440 [Motiliproteus sp. MSK22-1]|nr:hypothetical protein BGP75_07440 [Motiliproteus sp. MSK22-1]